METVASEDLSDQRKQNLRKEGGQWLKSLRESNNISQREMADRIDVSYYTFVSQIESGRGRIPTERYRVWAEALGIEPKIFVRDLLKFYEPSTYDILFA